MTDRTLPGRPPQWASAMFAEVLALRSEVAALRGAPQPPEPAADDDRAGKIASIRATADWLEANPWLPLPDLYAHRHVYELDGYREVLDLASRLGVEPQKSLDDRTTADAKIGCVQYSLVAWHDNGRPADEPADPTGLAYSREADDPAPVSPARGGQPHVVAVTDSGLVDETPAEVLHMQFVSGDTSCGLTQGEYRDGCGTANQAAVTCKACTDEMPF